MKARELAELLLEHPDEEIQVACEGSTWDIVDVLLMRKGGIEIVADDAPGYQISACALEELVERVLWSHPR
jgi:hypothetical protein